MNVADFTYLLQHPNEVVLLKQTNQLEDILEAYPYFQAAHSLRLKGLKNLNSFRYNNALKVTAAYTADREVLFDFITSKEFLQNTIANTITGKTAPLVETEIIAEEIEGLSDSKVSLIEDSGDGPLPLNIKDAEQILDPTLFTSKDPKVDKDIAKAKKKNEEELELGKPLSFTPQEKYSFAQWLQLTSTKTIDRDSPNKTNNQIKENFEKTDDNKLKRKKFELIDKFIEQNPKIVPKDKFTSTIDIKDSIKWDKNELMTETLARVYLEQKNYKKAIQSYKILSLKYPEKSGFFADRIKEVEKIQQENA